MRSAPRKRSEADIYHVFVRGVGRQCIFEDDEDNERFMGILRDKAAACDASMLAWCLMGNHFHLLVKAEMPSLSDLMKRLEVAYAHYFNERHDRTGCLFQGRFGSEPISDDAQLLEVIRYIHMNPQKAGIARFDAYRWSSYGEYVGERFLIDPSLALGVSQGIEGFIRFHELGGPEAGFMEESSDGGRPKGCRLTDGEVRRVLASELGGDWRARLLALPKQERDEILGEMKARGASVRQLARVTGIGRGVILKA